jgi:hypothetical protein
MIRRRDPGPYEDRVGPVVLTVLLVLSILVNMCLKFYDISRPEGSGGLPRSVSGKHGVPYAPAPAPEPMDIPPPAPLPVPEPEKRGKKKGKGK